jgi:hypothetical protein
MIDSRPYKVVWKKHYTGGEHVHYEQYTQCDTAQARVAELNCIDQVEATIHYPSKPVITPIQQLKKSCSSAQKSR